VDRSTRAVYCCCDYLLCFVRLEVESERNDVQKYPRGAYLEMEHHLLTLALVGQCQDVHFVVEKYWYTNREITMILIQSVIL
jgi:hypothetical protein